MTLSTSLLAEIRSRHVDFLSNFQFEVVDERYEPSSHFGNSYVTLQNREIRLRLVRDRGEYLCSVSALSESDEWLSLPDLMDLAAGRDCMVSAAWDLADLASMLQEIRSHLPKIAAMMRPENLLATKEKLAQFQRQRWARIQQYAKSKRAP
jgi:hypothetical protein